MRLRKKEPILYLTLMLRLKFAFRPTITTTTRIYTTEKAYTTLMSIFTATRTTIINLVVHHNIFISSVTHSVYTAVSGYY